ncbi:MAG: exsH, partial [Phenylobacterium sp.]|nr:exsH [Phenylobacterium sp.]
MTYYNYLGQPMPETAPEQSNVLGTPAGGETIRAPAGNSSAAGNGGGDTLIGSSGDNTFFITDAKDVVVEQPNGGIDTENGYMPITLAPNVENLVVHQDFNHGVGNSLDNLIITDGRAWLYGAGGNDVLVGATNTTTTFVEHAGEGNDVIYNWQGADQLQLTGFSFKTGADVRAAMTQQGSDVVLNMGGGQTLTFRNANVSTSFQDKQFLLPLDASKLGKLTFDDEFNSLSIYDPSHKTGTWSVDFGGNLKDQSAYSIYNNGEMQLYMHDGFEGLGDHNLHINPFSVSNGVLSITAQPITAPQDVSASFGHSWSSGMLNTLSSFQQKYGYFEIKAQLPNVPGSWPAFWMVPSPYQPSHEADVMESIGLQPNQDYRFGWGSNNIDDHALKLDPSGWHVYGMLWTATTTTFYMDGVAVASGPTPASWTQPMGMILNMAMGGWGGAADPSQYPASLKIDYVHAYALADGSTTVVNSTPPTPVATIQDETQPASIQAQQLTFNDTGQALSSGKIVLLSHDPTAADIPASGRAFIIWESGGQVRGAVANNGYLDSPTVLAAGSISQFSGAGTFLTDGRVVVAHTGTDAGQPAAYDLILDPATHTIQDHELGPSNGQVSFVPLANGNFGASWHTASGQIFGRAYNAFAYDSQGWWGPVRDLTADATGATTQGDLITGAGASQTAYHVEPFALSTDGTVSIGPTTVSHPEGNSGITTFTFTVTRSAQIWERATVAWKVSGFGANPVSASDFAGGWTPSGVVTLQGPTTTATITVNVAGDTTVEP